MILSARSTYAAVVPPTKAVMPWPLVAFGIVVSLRSVTRSSVFRSEGEVVGISL